ncbi:ArsR/SmtB family transcription factor [Oricola cellulosilytica]|uniref:Metalloregulator ArsR/SmtB family transcription factor n=1 Tax=Oricola cellulosilytica TaxID=1429082 RepID=A0A4R0PAS9_9HYPH|nr:metalloregulator ArsR/SmtB family transcription factor [Oricola cellulosilytica]TCD14341.1 metalloregulator ArsR/SmtB family transcription factor [Oricola cellulosilytica]
MSDSDYTLDTIVDVLKTIAESTRLRILNLLADGDLTVSELTEILGQSQPRVSRHLKLMLDAKLIKRQQEGSWALFRLSRNLTGDLLTQELLERLDQKDPTIRHDLERLARVKAKRREKASDYFSKNASSWDEIRTLHVADRKVEDALVALVGDEPVRYMLDLGTGTGRLLEVFSNIYQHGIGIDSNREMLHVARANLDHAGIRSAEVRLGDVYNLPVPRDGFDLVTVHQVLHYLDDPAEAISQAARALRPGGRLVIVDFAPHGFDFLRDEHAHRRLGFSDEDIGGWFADAELEMIASKALDAGKADGGRLTVKIWMARDPRVEIADDDLNKASPLEFVA